LTEYITIASNREALTGTPEVTIFVQGLTPGRHKYIGNVVRARVSEMDGADVLWRRTDQGLLDPNPLRLEIVQRLGVGVAGSPYRD